MTLLGVIHPIVERGGVAAESDGGGNGTRAPEAVEIVGRILGRGGGDRGLLAKSTPNQESCRSHAL
jgi:hypothetical protein